MCVQLANHFTFCGHSIPSHIIHCSSPHLPTSSSFPTPPHSTYHTSPLYPPSSFPALYPFLFERSLGCNEEEGKADEGGLRSMDEGVKKVDEGVVKREQGCGLFIPLLHSSRGCCSECMSRWRERRREGWGGERGW